jgi:serine/threonine protein kinase
VRNGTEVLNEQDKQEFVRYILMTMKKIHEEGFVHRDLKLSDFFVYKHNSKKRGLLLADFGLSAIHTDNQNPMPIEARHFPAYSCIEALYKF